MSRYTRRGALAGAATLAAVLAGCTGRILDETPEDLSFDRLHLTAVYVDPAVDLSVPDAVQTVGATHNAELLVLPDDPDTGPEQAVEWLADDRVVALYGPDAEATWHAWHASDAFAGTFDVRGSADAAPDPRLVVAAAVGLDVMTYRRSWSDLPRDRDVLRALDEVLVDLEGSTPT